MDYSEVEELKLFINELKLNPSIINDPSLGFFKNYIQSLGAQIPQDTESDNDDDELDIEFVDADVLEPDNDPLEIGDNSIEVTEENQVAAQSSKAKAMNAIAEGNLDEAIELLTEAIKLNPTSAIFYGTRASVYVKMKRPNAAIRDANAALKINPDLSKGYKSRGMAKAMLRQWEEAAKDLRVASGLDYDEEIGSMLKKVEPHARKIEERHRKNERLKKERELKKAEIEQQQKRAEAQAADERVKAKVQSSEKRTDSETASLQDGHVLSVHSNSELETKCRVAASLSRLVILYFTATWCGPCRLMSPLYTSLAGKYTNVVFLKVDIDELSDVAAKWNINSVPTFCFIRNGKKFDSLSGADKNGLEKKIAQYASQS